MNAIGISYILRYYLYALHVLVLLFEEIRNLSILTILLHQNIKRQTK